jgi:hypothetical protein
MSFGITWSDILDPIKPEGLKVRSSIEALDAQWKELQKQPAGPKKLAYDGFVAWRNWFGKLSLKTLFIDSELKAELNVWHQKYADAYADSLLEAVKTGAKIYAKSSEEVKKEMPEIYEKSLFEVVPWYVWAGLFSATTTYVVFKFLRRGESAPEPPRRSSRSRS